MQDSIVCWIAINCYFFTEEWKKTEWRCSFILIVHKLVVLL